MTMKEVDLVNLGVDKFGPRRKMMALITGNDCFQLFSHFSYVCQFSRLEDFLPVTLNNDIYVKISLVFTPSNLRCD
jgi:hypothetical protein